MRNSSAFWALGLLAAVACSSAGGVATQSGAAGQGSAGASGKGGSSPEGAGGEGGSGEGGSGEGGSGEGGSGEGGSGEGGSGGHVEQDGGAFGGAGGGTAGGSVVGGASGSGPVDDACAAVAQEAKKELLPADIIWVVDTSGSMSEEAGFVQNKLNAFAGGILQLGIDVHVVMIAEPLECPFPGFCVPGGICIPAPLGSGQCPGDSNPPFFFHGNDDVGSVDGFNVILQTFPTWKHMLRPNATKTIIAVTDDDATMPPYDKKTFADGAKGAAKKFIDDFTALDPQLLKGWKMNAIYSFTQCESAANVGETWGEAVAQTGGVKGDLCAQDFQPIFNDMAKAIVQGVKPLDCEWKIPPVPAGQEFNTSKVNVKYTAGSGQEQDIYYVDDMSKCDAQKGGWYFDDPSNPSSVLVCPSSCKQIQADMGAKIDILFGCERIPLDPK